MKDLIRMRPRSGTRLLVSVRSVAEAQQALAAGPYLIDAKDPERGALGALPLSEIAAIVASVRTTIRPATDFGVIPGAPQAREGDPEPVQTRMDPLLAPPALPLRSPGMTTYARTSAVAGEPETWDDLADCVQAVAASGVDLVKVALLPGMLDRLAHRTSAVPGLQSARVIAVLFAEDDPASAAVPRIAEAGFFGAMIDTRVKDGSGLLDRLPLDRLADFLRACRAHDLLTGLAGSLQLADIPALAALRPDYLGFRGGLCRSGRRGAELDPDRMRRAWRELEVSRPASALA
jgi:uncharacterized protein (UPF0264 family)